MKKTKPSKISRWKFSSSATENPPIEIDNPVEFLKGKFDTGYIFGQRELKDSGCYRLKGWTYDLRPWLKKYLVKQYGHWQEEYAPNKTAIRRTTYGRIERIVEITK